MPSRSTGRAGRTTGRRPGRRNRCRTRRPASSAPGPSGRRASPPAWSRPRTRRRPRWPAPARRHSPAAPSPGRRRQDQQDEMVEEVGEVQRAGRRASEAWRHRFEADTTIALDRFDRLSLVCQYIGQVTNDAPIYLGATRRRLPARRADRAAQPRPGPDRVRQERGDAGRDRGGRLGGAAAAGALAAGGHDPLDRLPTAVAMRTIYLDQDAAPMLGQGTAVLAVGPCCARSSCAWSRAASAIATHCSPR